MIWAVEQEKAKRMCPAPASPKAEPGAEPMTALSIRQSVMDQAFRRPPYPGQSGSILAHRYKAPSGLNALT
jgi:hypothetical protein